MIVLNKHTKDDTVLLFNNIVPLHWLIAGFIIEICNRLINKFISKEKSSFSSALFRGVGSDSSRKTKCRCASDKMDKEALYNFKIC